MNRSVLGMEYIKIVKDEENGLEAQTYVMADGRYATRLFDVDCGRTVGIKAFPSESAALNYADEIINP